MSLTSVKSARTDSSEEMSQAAVRHLVAGLREAMCAFAAARSASVRAQRTIPLARALA